MSVRARPDPLAVHPVPHPISGTVTVPGSKSLTNRALVAGALAAGTSRLHGALRADDTEAMVGCLDGLGIRVRPSWDDAEIEVEGCAGRPPGARARLDARLSGTTARFMAPVLALGERSVTLDGRPPLRARPLGPTIEALRRLGATVAELDHPGHLPIEISGGPLRGGAVEVPGDASSQFLSGLLLAGPATSSGLTVRVSGTLVSRPYVEMTAAVMAAFGAEVTRPDERTWSVAPTGYQSAEHRIEPDASAASYLFAAAALTGGTVTVAGLGTSSLQGDLAFVDVLEAMGARVERSDRSTTVTGTGALRGVEVDMADISDTAQTLAALAPFAEGPTRITGIGFIRGKETDRIGDVVTELRRCGITAEEEPDGLVVQPGAVQPAVVQTYHDHRMAMAFALLGLRASGIQIADPDCVAKTYPGYWDDLAGLGVSLG